MSKKYFWLKLHNNFFNQLEIKKIRLLEHGDLYTIIYLKLQLLSITTGGQLFCLSLEDGIVQELALELNESIENVQSTLALLEKYQLLEVLDESCLLLPKVAEIIGSESSSTERVRKMRLNNLTAALQCNSAVTKCNTEIELELEIKKEINVELYSDKDLAVNKAVVLDKYLPVELVPALDISLPKELSLALPLATDTIAMPINNTTREEIISLARETALEEIITPITADVSQTILSARELRFARKDLQEELDTKQKMQIITDRILARIKNEKPVSKMPLASVAPVIILENSFEDFWRYYPNAYDRVSTFKVWQKTLALGISATDLVYVAKKYALDVKNKQTLLCYVSSSRNFLMNNKFWEFLPTYATTCPHCQGKGFFSKIDISGKQSYFSCNCHQRYQSLSRTNYAVKASA